MRKRERVLAALRGEPADAVPVGFWGHNYVREWSPADLAAETTEKATRHDWDFVKIQPRATCFSEVWGVEWRRGTSAVDGPVQVTPVARSAADLARLADAPPDHGPLREQVEAVRLIRAALPDDRPILMTAFSPLMVLGYLFPQGPDHIDRRAALAAVRDDPGGAGRFLEHVAETISWFMRASLDAGVDGIFYATNMASAEHATADDVDRFERPYTVRLLGEIADAAFNMFHICGPRVHFERLADIPVTSLSWAAGDANPTLRQAHERYGRAVAGGIPTGEALRAMTPDAVARAARSAIDELGSGGGLLLAPDCSIRRDTPAENLDAVTRVARGGTGR